MPSTKPTKGRIPSGMTRSMVLNGRERLTFAADFNRSSALGKRDQIVSTEGMAAPVDLFQF